MALGPFRAVAARGVANSKAQQGVSPATLPTAVAAMLVWHSLAVNLLLILGEVRCMRWLGSNWAGNRGALPAVIALLSLLSAGPATAEKRIALVVGPRDWITAMKPANQGRVRCCCNLGGRPL